MKMKYILHNFEILPQRIQELSQQTLTDILQQMISYAKNHHPYKDRSGRLTESIQGEVVDAHNGVIKAFFCAQAEYAEAVEYGTHRGSQPLPFMRPTLERFKSQLEEALYRALQQALQETLR